MFDKIEPTVKNKDINEENSYYASVSNTTYDTNS